MNENNEIWPCYDEMIFVPSTNTFIEIKAFLDQISAFIKEYPCHPSSAENTSLLIFRAKDLFTQCIGFVVLSTLCGKNPYLKKKFKSSLSRGFRAFYGIHKLIDDKIILPKEIPLSVLEPFLERTPEIARAFPISHLAFVFIQTAQDCILWEDEKTLAVFLKKLFVEKISQASHSGIFLTKLLNWSLPVWVEKLDSKI